MDNVQTEIRGRQRLKVGLSAIGGKQAHAALQLSTSICIRIYSIRIGEHGGKIEAALIAHYGLTPPIDKDMSARSQWISLEPAPCSTRSHSSRLFNFHGMP